MVPSDFQGSNLGSFGWNPKFGPQTKNSQIFQVEPAAGFGPSKARGAQR